MNTTTQHWISLYLGKPWVDGGKGPDSYDCWGFAVSVYRDQYGIVVPDSPVESARNTLDVMRAFLHGEEKPNRISVWRDWSDVAEFSLTKDGDAVLMGAVDRSFHAGIITIVDGEKRIAHCISGLGVCLHTKNEIQRNLRMGSLKFFRHGTRN